MATFATEITCHFCANRFTYEDGEYIQICCGYCTSACTQCRDDTSYNLHVRHGTLRKCEFGCSREDSISGRDSSLHK